MTGRKKKRPSSAGADAMLDWIALYVTEINTLASKRGEKVELIAADTDDMVIIRRTGKTMPVAFRKCVTAAMKQLPR